MVPLRFARIAGALQRSNCFVRVLFSLGENIKAAGIVLRVVSRNAVYYSCCATGGKGDILGEVGEARDAVLGTSVLPVGEAIMAGGRQMKRVEDSVISGEIRESRGTQLK